MAFTHIIIGPCSQTDRTFCGQLRDDLQHILRENGTVELVFPPQLSLVASIPNQEVGWQWDRDSQEKNIHKIFLVVPSPNAITSSRDKATEKEIELALRRKNDPDLAKKLDMFLILYRPCQIPLNLESLQIISLLPPKTYEAVFQEMLIIFDLPSQLVSQYATMPASLPQPLSAISVGDHKPDAYPNLLTTNPDAIGVTRIFTGHIDQIYTVTLSADGQTLASGSRDMRIKLWNPQTGQLLRTLSGHTDDVRSLALGTDGRTLVSTGVDRTIKLWNTQTGQLLHTFSITKSLYNTNSIALSADGLMLAFSQEKFSDQMIEIWNLRKGKLLHSLKSYSSSLALSADGRMLASDSWDKTVKLWNPQKGKLLRTLSGHTATVHSLALNADGRTLVSGSEDKTIKLWSTQNGQLLRTLSGHTATVHSLALNADGRTLVSGSENEIQLWDTQTGQCLRILEIVRKNIYTQALRIENKLNRMTSPIRTHTESIERVVMSVDGSILVSCDQDRIIVWGVKGEQALPSSNQNETSV